MCGCEGARIFVHAALEGASAVPSLLLYQRLLRAEQRLLLVRIIATDGAIDSLWGALGLDQATALPMGRGGLIEFLDPTDKLRRACLGMTDLFERGTWLSK